MLNETAPESLDEADDAAQLVQITWVIRMRVTNVDAARREAIDAVMNTGGLDDDERVEWLEDVLNHIDVIAFELFDAITQQEPQLPYFEAEGSSMWVDLVESKRAR
ncbi:hypothetical protein GCM10007382_23470 [Salinibacterium xinjiangense]|uniref:Uncharacterized protein n=1 Tax=Salinibacterium xinjiangense TaxID=386302 RepID=A0A2C8ZVJ0_9MICO|nr:hypothetical protein [Salinibacterium xinjiangense]GGL02893.1 hypothetical protein GCM10007382_23470 [Salinibacterium xinjiangense]SOE69865.1 hypothetical protein SAMN06296378_2078 [Salinibacterium xinjiangense]